VSTDAIFFSIHTRTFSPRILPAVLSKPEENRPLAWKTKNTASPPASSIVPTSSEALSAVGRETTKRIGTAPSTQKINLEAK